MEPQSQSVVYLVDDDAGVRASLRFALGSLSPEYRLVDFGDAESFLAEFDDSLGSAQCLVADIRLPGMDGVALLSELRRRQIDLPVTIITGQSDVPIAVRAVQIGALDVLLKPVQLEKLQTTINKALELDRCQRKRKSERNDVLARMATLTEREREVMDGLLCGKFTKELASSLGIGSQTILKHRARLLSKMRVRGEIELAQLVQSLELTSAEMSRATPQHLQNAT